MGSDPTAGQRFAPVLLPARPETRTGKCNGGGYTGKVWRSNPRCLEPSPWDTGLRLWLDVLVQGEEVPRDGPSKKRLVQVMKGFLGLVVEERSCRISC